MNEFPYLLHINLVSMEVMTAISFSQNILDANLSVQCALLHDVIEDVGKSYDEIKNVFGKGVADGVDALTRRMRNSPVTKKQKMEDSLRRIKQQPREVWIVKMADRISNLLTPPPDWKEEKFRSYKAEPIEIFTIPLEKEVITPQKG